MTLLAAQQFLALLEKSFPATEPRAHGLSFLKGGGLHLSLQLEDAVIPIVLDAADLEKDVLTLLTDLVLIVTEFQQSGLSYDEYFKESSLA